MYCPNCKSEYREEFSQCACCGVSLVSALPKEKQNDVQHIEMVEVFSTYNYGDIAFIKSVLEGECIHYYFQGENSNLMVGGGAFARLLVQEDQAERVRDLLQEMGFPKE